MLDLPGIIGQPLRFRPVAASSGTYRVGGQFQDQTLRILESRRTTNHGSIGVYHSSGNCLDQATCIDKLVYLNKRLHSENVTQKGQVRSNSRTFIKGPIFFVFASFSTVFSKMSVPTMRLRCSKIQHQFVADKVMSFGLRDTVSDDRGTKIVQYGLLYTITSLLCAGSIDFRVGLPPQEALKAILEITSYRLTYWSVPFCGRPEESTLLENHQLLD
jgi:hypothetical protein